MKTIILILFICSAAYSQNKQVGLVLGDTNSVAGSDTDKVHRILSVADLKKLFTESYNFTIYCPSDTLFVHIGNDTNFTAGRIIPVYPGIPLVIKNIDVLFNKYISIKSRSATSGRKPYLWGLGGL